MQLPETHWNSGAYIAAFHWAMSTTTSIGYGDIVVWSGAERVYGIVICLAGAVVYSIILGACKNNISDMTR